MKQNDSDPGLATASTPPKSGRATPVSPRNRSEKEIHVLLVEDNPTDAHLVRSLLALAEPTAVALMEAESLQAARALLSEREFDVVLLDLFLPDARDLEALSDVPTLAPNTPVVVLTVYEGDHLGLEAVRMGAQDYLTKAAINPETLLRSLHFAVERRRREVAERALEREEKYFRALVEHDSDIITVLEADGTIRYESPAVERVLGYRAADRVGTSAFELIHPDDLPRVLRIFETAVPQLGVVRTLEYRLRHADGSWRTLRSTGNNLLADPAVGGLVITSHDITDQLQLEARLLEARKMEAMGQLAGGISHDLNNILMAIKGTAALLLGDHAAKEESLREDLEQIERSADRAAAITRQLLAFSRKQMLRPEVLDLNLLVSRMEPMLRRMVGEQIHLALRLGPALGHARADPVQIEQAIVNLVCNARDAMPGGGTLTVETRNVDPGDHRAGSVPDGLGSIQLSIADTGSGIDEVTRSRIWEPFFTREEQGRGTGLGLAAVYGIVQQSGGDARAESTLGAGTTFTICLPRTAEEGTPTAHDVATHGSATVLLVEDETAVRRVARRMLERGGYHVLEAAGPEEAFSIANDGGETIDLLLTDVIMPGGTGPQLADRLVKLRPELKVLYMSGFPWEQVAASGERNPAAVLLQKPFEPHQLLRAVAGLLITR